jgi:hypothetical protein
MVRALWAASHAVKKKKIAHLAFQVTFITLEELKDGSVPAIDAFNNAHILIIDLSDSKSRPSLRCDEVYRLVALETSHRAE